VVIDVALEGLTASEGTSEDSSYELSFLDGEREVLSYSKLLVVDADGKELPATMEPTESGFSIAYHDTGANYPINFGFSVAISGDSVVVGANLDGDAGTESGSAYVFIRSGITWTQQAKLTADDAAAGEQFGGAVAISGDSIVVGAFRDDDAGTESGSAYVFTRSGITWTQQAKLTASDAAGDNQFGISVAVSGNSVVVGANEDDDDGPNSGSAYVFTRSGIVWSEEAKLTASDADVNDQFGTSVAILGDSVVVGANFDDGIGTRSGSAYVFTRSGTAWSEQAKLTANDAAAFDNFGISVSISGNSVVVGANSDSSGSAYVFTRSGTSWSEQAKLTASDGLPGDSFGISVSISGDSVVVGAFRDDDVGTSSGSAYVFTRSGIAWSEQAKLTANDEATNDRFGISVGISGDSVVVGAHFDDDDGVNSGSAYVFTRSGITWSEQAKLTANDAASGDQFGVSVSISGDSVVVGAFGDDDGEPLCPSQTIPLSLGFLEMTMVGLTQAALMSSRALALRGLNKQSSLPMMRRLVTTLDSQCPSQEILLSLGLI